MSTDGAPPPSLTTLDPELQLLIFQSFRRGYATACLCRLEQTCKAFSAAGQLLGNEEEGVSLPEIAARLMMAHALALPVRPDGLKPIRPYERGPGEGHKHVLNLLERGLLTRGVLHGVTESAVERTGWQLAYSEPYCHRTQASDLERVPATARYVMVAAIYVGPEDTESFAARAVRAVFGRLELGNPFASATTERAAGEAGGAAGERRFRLLAWGRRETVLKVRRTARRTNPHPHPNPHHHPPPSPSPFTAHRSPLTAHHSPLTSHLSPSPSPSPLSLTSRP